MAAWRYLPVKVRIGQLSISVSFYFFALLALASLSDKSGSVLIGLVAALLHECGHLLVIAATGSATTKEIRLTVFGAEIDALPTDDQSTQWLLALCAGPAANLFGALVAALLIQPLEVLAGTLWAQRLGIFCASNMLLALLNLMPVQGFDGAKILHILLVRKRGMAFAEKTVRICTLAALPLILAAAAMSLIHQGMNFSLPLVAFWLCICCVRLFPKRKC